MEKVTKNARIAELESKLMVMQTQINSLIECGHSHTKRLIALEPDNPFHGKFYEPSEPKPKQLDQSVFDGLDAKWRFAAVDKCGEVWACTDKVFASRDEVHLPSNNQDTIHIKGYYDASNWQNSLIERDIAKELLEVDLSSELTGSDLCRKMLARGDSRVVCLVSNISDKQAVDYREHTLLIEGFAILSGFWDSRGTDYKHAVPVSPATNEPLTAADAGL